MPSSIPRGPIQVLFQPGWQAGVDHQFTPFKSLYDDSQQIDNPSGEKIVSNTTTLHFTYNITQKAGFIITVPFHNRDYRRLGENGVESGTVSGLGDMVVRARFAPVANFSEDHSLVWTVEAGMKLPSGDSSLLRDSGGHHHPATGASGESGGGHHHSRRDYLAHEGHDHGAEAAAEAETEEHHEEAAIVSIPAKQVHSAVENHDLALGSGSVDGVIGTGVIYRGGNFYASAGGQYLLRSQGTAGYRYGDLLTWRVAPGYLFINEANKVVGLQLNISGEHHDPNRVYGAKDHGYTDVIFVGPEVVTQGENLSLNLGVDLPVKYHAEGLTVAPDYRTRLNFNWRF